MMAQARQETGDKGLQQAGKVMIVHARCAGSGLISIARPRPVLTPVVKEASGERLSTATLPELNLAQSVIARRAAAANRRSAGPSSSTSPSSRQVAAPVLCATMGPQEFAAAQAVRRRLD